MEHLTFLQVGGVFNICDMVREYVESGYGNGSDLGMLNRGQLRVLVKAVNDGQAKRGNDDNRKVLVDFVKEKCICLMSK